MKRIMLLVTVLLSSCSFTGMKVVKPSGTSSIAPGTTVDFSKAMNPAFARDYNGADIITHAQFYAAGAPRGFMTSPPKDHIVFQVIPQGGSVKSGFAGMNMGDIVFLPKSKGSLVFELQTGDVIELRGGTRVRKGLIGSAEMIEFVATEVRRL